MCLREIHLLRVLSLRVVRFICFSFFRCPGSLLNKWEWMSGREGQSRERRERQCRKESKYGTYSETESDSGLASAKGEDTRLLELKEDLPETACATVVSEGSKEIMSDLSDADESVGDSTVVGLDSSVVRAKPQGDSVRPSRRSSVVRRESGREGEYRRSVPRSTRASERSVSRASVARSTRESGISDGEDDLSDEESECDMNEHISSRDVKRLIKTMTLSMHNQFASKSNENASREIQSLVSYRDSDEIHHYIMGLEADLKDLEVPVKKWKRILLRKLTPKARKAVRGVVSESECSYEQLKRALVKKLGLSRSAVTDKLFGTGERELRAMDHVSRFQTLRDNMERLALSCDSAKDVPLAVVVGLFRTTLYPSEKCLLESRSITSYEDLYDVAEMLKSGAPQKSVYGRGRHREERKGSPNGSSEGFRCFKCQGVGHKASECRRSECSSYVTCYVCNQQGHKAWDCPSRADKLSKGDGGKVDEKSSASKRHQTKSQAAASSESSLIEFKGKCNGRWCFFLPDSGAVMSMVSTDLVDRAHMTGEYKSLVMADGSVIRRPLARVSFDLRGRQFDQVVAVSDQGNRKSFVFLSAPPESDSEAVVALEKLCDREALRHLVSTGKEDASPPPVPVSAVVTRAASTRVVSGAATKEQVKTSKVPPSPSKLGVMDVIPEPAGEVGDAVVPEVSGCPERGDVTDISESSTEVAECNVHEEERVRLDEDEECDRNDRGGGSVEEDVLECLGSPSMAVRDEKEVLRNEIVGDETLKGCRDLASKQLNGYVWRENLLFHEVIDNVGDKCSRLVLPINRRADVLTLAHDKNGHVGVKAMRSLINKRFTWPGLGRDIVAKVNQCDTCLRHNRAGNKQAKLVERQVISVPFDFVAFDLVGPLPKSRGGVKYVLTYICLASRWPEAVALRSVTAEAVASAMCNIIFRTGIPAKILTDRGTVFLSKVVAKLCEILGCDQIQSSPYRPQTNGALERFHGTLKPMLSKAIEEGITWADFLPMALFAIRQVPNRSTGVSPHELVYGRAMVGPPRPCVLWVGG